MRRALPSGVPALAAMALAAASIGGCAGGVFLLEEPLTKMPPMGVTGKRYGASCEAGAHQTGAELLAEASPTTTQIGDATLTVDSASLDVTTYREHGEAVMQKLVGRLAPSSERKDQVHSAIDSSVVGSFFSAESTAEKLTLPYALQRGGRLTIGLCVGTVTGSGRLVPEAPVVTLRCTIVPEGGPPRRLEMLGNGTWAAASYRGVVTGAGARWSVASQNVKIMGIGAPRGFDVRAGAAQIGALSYFEQGPADGNLSKAWAAPQATPDGDDALVATLGLLNALPWPTACDAHVLGMRSKPPE